ncbi:2-dehydro-3-deoxyglucarate aldolase [Rhodococcus opacus M213]|uniref:2-dehydro-3-deoxyglucarate aldolase n=1 Tax=Rhodococcus opacus M213 TaxID=1129896 RepID=K8XM69_RHOOP|nr:aldolase/citrate lyase family protein [Rhodococcus opacus]EKT81926.1 2-dehydro-3-deoxyglucarate aldolase [Rhodococcus opacus M213]
MTGRMKERLAAGEQLLGVLVRMPAEELVEMAGMSGIDYVLIDCEHGPADLIPLRQHITAAQLHGMDVLVRVGQNEPALIQRVLDHGATGIVVPHVDDAEQAADVVRTARYAPVGDRGFATYGRAGRFGSVSVADHLTADAEGTVVIVMVESETGCRNVDDIVSVPGVDGVMGGPADLAVSLGVAGPSDPSVVGALDTVRAAVTAGGRVWLEIVSGEKRAQEAFDAGAGLVVINLSHVLMELFGALRRIR